MKTRSTSAISRRHFLKSSAALVAGAGFSPGMSSASEQTAPRNKRPNLLFVLSDQQRRHSLSCMGQDPVLTPHLDAFANDGLLLTNAISASPVCTPFRGSLLTGCHPATTGCTTNESHLETKYPSIGTTLQTAGYHTGWIGKWHLHNPANEQYGRLFVTPDQRHGFEFWHAINCNHDLFWKEYYENDPTPVVNERGWQIPHETDVALRFLQSDWDKNRPFALFVSCVPPHNGTAMGRSQMPLREAAPGERPMLTDFHRELVYHAPEEWENRYREMSTISRLPNVAGDYARHHCIGHFGGVDAMDHEFGRLIAYLKANNLYDNTIIVYTSDHGEMMGSHDLMSKCAPHEESIGIPFVMRYGKNLPRGRSQSLLSQVDMAPTILGLMGLSSPDTMEGVDVSHALQTGSSGHQEDVLLYFYSAPGEIQRYGKFGMGWRGLRSHDSIYVEARDYHVPLFGKEFYYDLVKDPYQLKPIRFGDDASTDKKMRYMQARLHKKLEETPDTWTRQSA